MVATHLTHLVPKLATLGHLVTFSGAKRLILGQLGALKGFVLLIWDPLEGPKWARYGSVMPTQ